MSILVWSTRPGQATPEGYNEISAFHIPNAGHASWAYPVVVGGRMYLREQDSVWCYNVKQR